MSRGVAAFNFFGVVALAALSVAQWRENRRLNQEVNRLENVRLEASARLEEKERFVRGQATDLETLRGHVTRLGAELKGVEDRRRTVETERGDREREMAQMRESAREWKAGLEARDVRIRELGVEMERLGALVNEARSKHNALAEEYGKVVGQLEERTRQWNEVVKRLNAVGKGVGGAGQ